MTDIEFYQPRRVKEIKLEEVNNKSYYGSESLEEVISQNNRIFLLGNAGIGKSTELKILCEDLNTEIVLLRSFTTGFTIKKYLPKSISLKKKPNQVLVFDGLDEVADIHNTLSHIETFLRDYNEVKVVISCRTNIYEKYGVKLEGFKIFILELLSDREKLNLIRNKTGVELTYSQYESYQDFLGTPFAINQFCDFYISQGVFPKTQEELWNLFIEQELETLSKSHLQKREKDLDVYYIKECLQQVAIINELMSSNFIEGINLYTLLGKEDKAIIEQISFIEQIPNSKRFGFRHKIYQEFFAAQYLKSFDFNKILELIVLDETVQRTKPSLFNVISFLLNILDLDKFNELKDWLLLNEPDILLLCEEDRLDKNTQKEVFEKYFNNEVINTTFWIQRNNRFPLERLAKFADIDYLINIVKKDSNHRITISAFDVLCCVPNSATNKEITTLLYDSIIGDSKYQEHCFEAYIYNNFDLFNKDQFHSLLDYLTTSNDLAIQHCIIKALSKDINQKRYFGFLLTALDKLYLEYEEKQKDNVVRMTTHYVAEIIIDISDIESFFELIQILNNTEYSLKLSDVYKEKFVDRFNEKVISILYTDKIYLDRFIHIIMTALKLNGNDFINYAIKILVNCDNNFSIVQRIVCNYGISVENSVVLCELVDDNVLEYLLKEYNEGILRDVGEKELRYLRNRLFQKNNQIGYIFEREFIEAGFSFIDLLETEQDRLRENKRAIDNFNILFDINAVKNLILKVFKDNNVDALSLSLILDIESDWFNANPFFNYRNSIYEILSSILEETPSKLETIYNVIDRKPILLSEINERLNSYLNKNSLTHEQLQYIERECQKIIDNIDFESIINLDEDGRITMSQANYYNLGLLVSLDKKLNLNFDQQFYIGLLANCEFYNLNNEYFDYVVSKIKDNKSLNQQIVKNIQEKKLNGYVLEKHIKHSLSVKLQQCYTDIGIYIQNSEFIGFKYDVLKSYIDLIEESKVVSFLKGCCQNLDSMLCWNAIKIFVEREYDNSFIINLSKKYLSMSRCEEKEYNFIGNALSVLFYTNHKDSLKEYYLALKDKENRRDDFTIETINDFKSFSNKDITEIEKIFYLVYNDKIIDNFAYYSAKSYLAIFVSNCSNNKKDYDRIKTLIKKMLKKSETNDTYVFFLNHLLKGADTAYYNSLVRQYSFSEAKALLEYKKQDVTIMLKDVLYACNLTQQNKLFWGTEDERTKQVLDLLSMKYATKDQSTYGISSGGKLAGEVDGVISDLSGVEKFIEAVNLKSIDKSSLSLHISKLEQKYDSKGLKEKYLIIYCNSNSKFQDFCTRYYKYINSEYQFDFRKISVSIEKIDYVEQYLIKSTHLRNNQEVHLYHILLNMR